MPIRTRQTIAGAVFALVSGLARASTAPTPAEIFAARQQEVAAHWLTEEGRRYDAAATQVLWDHITPWAFGCTKLPAKVPVNFDIALKLGAKGHVDELLVDPPGEFASCFARYARQATYPPPPTADYWIVAGLYLATPLEPESAGLQAGRSEPSQGQAPAQGPARQLRATFIGNMAFYLTDGKTAILTDFPYVSGSGGYMTWSKSLVPAGPAPLCLFTHAHADHFAWKLLRDHCDRVLGSKGVVHAAGRDVRSLALTPEMLWNGIAIRPLATPHADMEHYSYLLEWGGNKLYFSGDTNDPATLLEARDLDVAFVSPWLLDSIRSKGARIDARRVVISHHRADQTFPEAPGQIVPKQGQVIEIGPR